MHACTTVDVIYDAQQWEAAKRSTALMNGLFRDDPPSVERYTLVPRDDARRRFLCPDALGAVTYHAGSVWPYRLATSLLQLCLAKGLNLQTETPVTSLARGPAGSWTLQTPRGAVAAGRAILATNAYTAAILPALHGCIVPLRGQVSAQRPGAGLPKPALRNTYTFAYAAGYEYMVARPGGAAGEGDIVIGGGWAKQPGQGAAEFGVCDDAALCPGVSAYLASCAREYFGANWGEDHAAGRVKAEWSGIMGNTADGVPFVGEVPGWEGLWVCAGFNGHGMVYAERCGEAVAGMVVDGVRPAWLPDCFAVAERRLAREFEGTRDVKPVEVEVGEDARSSL